METSFYILLTHRQLQLFVLIVIMDNFVFLGRVNKNRLSVEKSALQNFINSRTPVGSERSSLTLNDQRRTRSCVGFSTPNI
jgi:hypothetical protein